MKRLISAFAAVFVMTLSSDSGLGRGAGTACF